MTLIVYFIPTWATLDQMKILAAVVKEQSGSFLLEELETDTLRDDEILVRIAGAGICHTDLICRDQVYPVPLPCVFGHEGSGVVEQTGSAVNKVVAGDHVVLSFRSCGQCDACIKGDLTHCMNIFPCNFSGTRDDGTTTLSCDSGPVHGSFFSQSSFANYAISTETNTVKVRDDIPLELLGPLGCGIQTGAGAVMNTLKPEAASNIVIFGCGSVGLAAIMAAHVVGCTTIIAVDPLPQRLELASHLGATHTINPKQMDAVEQIQQITSAGAQYSLECTGLPAVLRQAVDALSVTGVCGLVGAAPPGTECTFDMNSIMFGRTVRGIIEGDSIPDIFIPQLIELYRHGRFPIDKLVTFYPLNEIDQAIKDMDSGKVVKPVLRP